MKEDKTCPLAWGGIAYYPNGTFTLCCRSAVDFGSTLEEALESKDLVAVKKAMRDGKEHMACKQCYDEERMGVVSLREKSQEKYKDFDVQIDYSSDQHKVITFDTRMSNICNLKCRTCSPISSNKIHHEYKKIQKSGVHFKHYENSPPPFWPPTIVSSDQTLADILKGSAQLRQLYVSGGEPLLDQNVLQLIEGLVDKGRAKNIRLEMHTNGTFFNEKVFGQLSEFKEVLLMVSIDAHGEAFEYLRSGAKWAEVEENLLIYSEQYTNIKTVILCTLSIYNIMYMKDFLNWYVRFSNDYFYPWLAFNFLLSPSFMSLKLLPNTTRQQIVSDLQKFESILPKEIFDSLKTIQTLGLNSDLEKKLADLQQVTNEVDKWRHESFKRTLPLTWDLIQKIQTEYRHARTDENELS